MPETVRVVSSKSLLGDLEDALTDAQALAEATMACHQDDPEDTSRWEKHDEMRRTGRELELIRRRLAAVVERTPDNEHAGERTYRGERSSRHTPEVKVLIGQGTEQAETVPLDPRNDLLNHSRDGVEWGYAGSGPAQLALAILADATRDDGYAVRRHQEFKREVIQKIHAMIWTINGADVAAWAEDHP